ncbi:MAG: lipoyl synthase [Pseudomonadota bacterium]|jgi:lipoic acid synthetase|nr:lipoyl synthase [Pseudomonadota bacterium]
MKDIIQTVKIVNHAGVSSIKDGMKSNAYSEIIREKKPKWIRISANQNNKSFELIKERTKNLKLSTVCEEAKCPNLSECWSRGTATFMVMGDTCTRACQFCSVNTGNPKGWLDKDEPEKIAKTVQEMGIRYVVLTCVTRDDLSDGGAQHFAETVKAIKSVDKNIEVEVLTSDFNGDQSAIRTIVNSPIKVFAQNIETVERLTHPIRDPRAGYLKTMEVLKHAKEINKHIITKSSIIVGLGENDREIYKTFEDLRNHNVDIVTLGQYLRPTLNHHPIDRWVTPEEFEMYREKGLEYGFLEVVSGPMVRSSYRAERALELNNAGL